MTREQSYPYQNNHWHLDKRVSVGHLVTTIVVVATFVIWLMRMDGRMSIIENEVIDLRNHDTLHLTDSQTQFQRLEVRMADQTKRLETRMNTQYTEIIRRLELLDARIVQDQRDRRIRPENQ